MRNKLISFNNNNGLISDWWSGARKIEIWGTLAWFDVILRYRRSTLGPLWITISMGAMIAGMGPLYAALFGADLNKFFPHIALGIIFWNLFLSVIQESSTVFISSANFLRQSYFPISLFTLRMLARCVIQFMHHIILYVPIILLVSIDLSLEVLFFIPAFLLFLLNAHFVTIIVGIICTRFRDFAQIINSLMQLLMFLTPVIWMPENLPDRASILLYNPFALMLDILRTPLLGGIAEISSWVGVAFLTLCNFVLAVILFSKYRRRIVFWI